MQHIRDILDTLKEICENVESRNIVAFIRDANFYHCIYYIIFLYISLIALILPSFYLFFFSHKLNALIFYGTGMAYFVLMNYSLTQLLSYMLMSI